MNLLIEIDLLSIQNLKETNLRAATHSKQVKCVEKFNVQRYRERFIKRKEGIMILWLIKGTLKL